jgi:PBSX family phage terminase large subunit
VDIKYTQKQDTVVRYENNHFPLITILEGAVRSGKTVVAIDLFYWFVAEQRGRNADYIITGHTVGSVERNVLKPLSDRWNTDTKLDIHNRFSLHGNTVHCFGADKTDSYKAVTGMTSFGWYANEVTLQHKNTINEAFQRCSGDNARIFWDTNPDYPEHYIKTGYIDKSGDKLESGKVRIKSWHFELDDNTFLSPEYIENVKKTTPSGMWYNRRIKGQWVAAEGLIYEDWNPEIHVVEPFDIPSNWQRVRGIDWGFNNPFVCLWGAIDGDGRLYIYDELYVSHVLIKYHAREIKKRQGKFDWTVADHDAQDNAEIRDHGIYTLPAQKDVSIGIQKVAERLVVQGDGRPRFYVFRNCVNTRREMGAYRWQEQKDGKPAKEEPLKLDDHCPDTVRYIIMEIDNTHYIRPSKVSAGELGL